jgi:hypothetical protein
MLYITGYFNPSGSEFSNKVSTVVFTPTNMTWWPEPKMNTTTVFVWPDNITGTFPRSFITVNGFSSTSGQCTNQTYDPLDGPQGTFKATAADQSNIVLFTASMIVPDSGGFLNGVYQNFGQYYGVLCGWLNAAGNMKIQTAASVYQVPSGCPAPTANPVMCGTQSNPAVGTPQGCNILPVAQGGDLLRGGMGDGSDPTGTLTSDRDYCKE